MKAEDVKRKPKEQRKTIPINIRITKHLSKWLKEKNYSPTAIFENAVKELKYKNEYN